MTTVATKMATHPLTARERATILGALWLWGNMLTGGDWATDNPPDNFFTEAEPLTAAEAQMLMDKISQGDA